MKHNVTRIRHAPNPRWGTETPEMIDEHDELEAPRHKGIKIKELARELGCTSRELIDRCRAAGINVQNSITRLNRASAEKARSLFRKGEHGGISQADE